MESELRKWGKQDRSEIRKLLRGLSLCARFAFSSGHGIYAIAGVVTKWSERRRESEIEAMSGANGRSGREIRRRTLSLGSTTLQESEGTSDECGEAEERRHDEGSHAAARVRLG